MILNCFIINSTVGLINFTAFLLNGHGSEKICVIRHLVLLFF